MRSIRKIDEVYARTIKTVGCVATHPISTVTTSISNSSAASVAIYVQHLTLQPIVINAEGVVVEITPNPAQGVANFFALDVETLLYGCVGAKNLEGKYPVFIMDAE